MLNYDAENNTFTTDQTVVLNGSKNDWAPYQAFTNVVITKMPDFAATPADPIFEKCDLSREVGYNKIYASIPTVDVDGNELITSKLFYSIWIEKDGELIKQYITVTNLGIENSSSYVVIDGIEIGDKVVRETITPAEGD